MSRSHDPVRIVDYDPSWPDLFQTECQALGEVFEGRVVVEHVGSTSVPGLAAKPIVDILIGAASLKIIESRAPAIEALGYRYRPEFEEALPMRRYFEKPPETGQTHHLHCVEEGGDFWRDHLLFRDFLRGHPEVAVDYAALKRDLARRYGRDREGYSDAKSSFIEAVKTRARADPR
jgi:GrpB-like predicted nucleotidyltransferase (UPF0157 family)